MKRVTEEQRAVIVRQAINERDAILAGAPIISAAAALKHIREAIATDRCDGESEYARGINAACENHLKLIDAITASIWQPEVQAVEQTLPPNAHGNEPEQETAGALIEAGHGRKPVLVDRATFRDPRDNDGLLMLPPWDVQGPRWIPTADDDGGTKWNKDGTESGQQCVLIVGDCAEPEGKAGVAIPQTPADDRHEDDTDNWW